MAAIFAHSLSPLQLSPPTSRILVSPFPGLVPTPLKSHQRKHRLVAATEGSDSGDDSKNEDPSVPSWARPGSEEPPPWARQEPQQYSSGFAVPFYVYLLASTIAAIAAVGSIFEYVNQRPVFGVLDSDSRFYAPVLGFFVFVGFPSSVFLWFKSVQVANKEAEEQDQRDGYR